MRQLGFDVLAALRYLPTRGWTLHLVEDSRLIRIPADEIAKLAERESAYAVVASKRHLVA